MTAASAGGMPVGEAVASRIAVRAFRPDPVPKATVERLLREASQCPSGGNLQPWRVVALAGPELERLKALMREKTRDYPLGSENGYSIYPAELGEPYRTRRAKCGEDMYATMGIVREDKAARLKFIAGNFQFWGAPVGMFFCIDRGMGPPQWSDLGMYIQTLMLLAREAGLDTCPQEAWTTWDRTVSGFLGLPPNLMIFCGLALGYADTSHPVNRLRTDRAALDEFASLRGF